MSKSENQDLFLRNNTGNKSKLAIIEGFVVRTAELNEITDYLQESVDNNNFRNIIIIGQRGAGKTTLMHRLNYFLLEDDNLSEKYLPILFTEEQYNLSDLTNLWEAIAVFIEDNFYTEDLTYKMEQIIEEEDDYEQKSFTFLHNFLVSVNKTVILFIENINYFLKKLSQEEKERLKSIVTSSGSIKIIGSSTSFSDGSIDFTDSFYDFLQIVPLNGLSQEECIKLLIKIGQQYGEEEQIKNVINNYPGRVEALRRLTGGIPRTISYLFQIFLDNENGKAIKDLYLLIDTLTLLYKSELDQLSAQQQKVIDVIARRWDAISVKEIAKKTRLESKNISSILSYLEKNQLIEKVPTSTKNHLYRIKERFMNIWYLMRFGRKHDKDNVVWLVRFFDAWCDESELTNRLKKYIRNVKDGKYDPTAAIDMGNTFLSCENLPDYLKEELINTTNSILPNRLLKGTRTTSEQALTEIKKLINEGHFTKAVEKLLEVDEKDIDYYTVATSAYLNVGDTKNALESAKTALDIDNSDPLANLIVGIIYDMYLDDQDSAIKYYKKCLSLPQEHPYAANLLGNIYSKRKDFETAIEYHNKAISKNFKQPLLSLGKIYIELEDFEKAEDYFKEAIKAKVEGAYTELSKLLVKTKRNKEALAALKNAVNASEEKSHIILGLFYLMGKKPNFKQAEVQFLQAIEKGEVEGYEQLGKLYSKTKEIEKAEATYIQGVKQNSSESAHRLAHLYNKKRDFEKADEMFQKSIDLGDSSVLGCWIEGIYDYKRFNKKKNALDLVRKHIERFGQTLRFNLLYAKMLLWNDKTESSIQIIKDEVPKVISTYNDENEDMRYSHTIFTQLVDFFLLLIAKKEYQTALELFDDSNSLDLKTVLKPVYYLLMGELKSEFPLEYLKAGKELTETINDLKKEVEYLRKK
ncbi:tetratricopeptide repeat protein [Flavobacterium sp. SORGH_AS_0622]|uniref:tetratricopeptide repeat protein n=1 Tax=Flavobacterium sp. SORGH_AS_0622 TaxID=3041772 RepID=UPI002787091C|nr:tetratricopeptide repeat protein [Flavobacterium sp. SORGH_AS_0622]MDQ1166411.1 tetratricopeptide (TPR) repeat protein [Flavobacterium sp. SORGH_AS_0622]